MVLVLSIENEALKMHRENQGKLSIISKVPVKNKYDLSLAYSPGVAEPCREIYENPELIYDYTMKGNCVAVVTDGTAVLGLGDIGPRAAMPVMEGKAILLKAFSGVDAIPICLDTTDVDKIIETVKSMSPGFGGINLEDIAAPSCFEIERRLQEELDIPVFHDDQHGTAIVTLAGLINALKVTRKGLSDIRIVINGAGAAGMAIIQLLLRLNVKNIIMCDSKGAIYEGRTHGMNPIKEEIAKITNANQLSGELKEVIKGSDVFIGVSAADALDQEMIQSMNTDPIIFAMANPIPEIMPEEAINAGARVVGTGRSDYPNQINNVLAFPGIFRGALDVRAGQINEEMKLAAVYAIAELITDEDLSPTYIIPSPFDHRVAPMVAARVAQAAIETKVAGINVDPKEIYAKTMRLASISSD